MDCAVKCPWAGHTVVTTMEWVEKNGKVYCNDCCKAFDVEIRDDGGEDEATSQDPEDS